ncbi:MAG TPA: sugar ABC transporter permease, partial [Firmicutes bacterium]|nr:sugar ABC transporter permease [Bacillota bacterium]
MRLSKLRDLLWHLIRYGLIIGIGFIILYPL